MLDEATSKTFRPNNGKMMSGEEELKFKGTKPVGTSYVTITKEGKISLRITNGTYTAEKSEEASDISLSESVEGTLTTDELTTLVNTLQTEVANLKSKNIEQDTSIVTNNTAANMFLKVYPVGSIYITTNSTNPSDTYGGTWESYGTGKTLVGIDTAQTEFNTVNKVGGEKTHTLTIAEMPSHSHAGQIYTTSYNSGVTVPAAQTYITNYSATGNVRWSNNTSIAGGEIANLAPTRNTGSSQAHNNLQPYITVYMWKRTN